MQLIISLRDLSMLAIPYEYSWNNDKCPLEMCWDVDCGSLWINKRDGTYASI